MSTENRRETIARAALELADRDGVEALSMRRLAAELGMGTMTLYGYFRTKDELLEAVTEQAAAEYVPPPGDAPWEDRLRAVARSWRGGLARHPALVHLRLRRPITGPAVFRGTETGMRALLDAGFAPAEAARAFRLVFLFVFGFVAFSDPEVSEERRGEIAAAAARLPRDEFPLLSGMAGEMADTLGGDEQFEYGLDVLLGGLAARVPR